ncbi:MAG: CHASE domain-containing protein [Burkholderiales bacterium]|nr:CHASE domain-containing protein [Burkholderiales bacterium]
MRQELAVTSPWIRAVITWLLCTAVGTLAVCLASPQDHIAPLYLSAGIGLACVLGWGTAMMWPVGLGSASVMLLAQWQSNGSAQLGPVLALALVCGLGAAVQAWVGARWSRASLDAELSLEHPKEIGRFLLIAGPIACLINAGVSVPAMVALGLLPADQGPQAALAWWVGDTLGVLIGTPMMLTLVGQPADLWRARRLVVGVPLLVTTLVLGATIHQTQQWEQERAQVAFDRDVQSLSSAIQLQLNGYLDAVEALHGVYVASNEVTRKEFHTASSYWLASLSGIQAVGWNERLTQAQRPQFEARQRAEGIAGYQVFDTKDRRPSTESEMLAIRFIEPLAGNEAALGANVLSTPAARAAYERSQQEGRTVASSGFALSQETGQQVGVVLYRAIYPGEPPAPLARAQASRGTVFVALRMGDAIQAMTKGRSSYISVCLVDASAGPPLVLGGDASCGRDVRGHANMHRGVTPIDFAGRTWQLIAWAHAPVAVPGQMGWPWLLSIGGVLLAAALGALLLVITGYTRRVEMAMNASQQQKAAAEASNRAKSDFLSRMSHELRTPLNAVLGFAQVMDMDRQAPLPATQHQRLQQIQQAGWHLLDMIDDVLDLSRIDTGTLKLNTEIVPVAEAAQSALEAVDELAKQRQVQLLPVENALAGWGVRADRTRLRQILIALLSNAIKYNRPGGDVKLFMRMLTEPGQEDRIQIAVQDTGLGLSAEQVAQLFQPFNRLGRERLAPDGAGIGLVISQHLAQLMGGQLEAHSEEGKCSTFTLTLAAARVLAVRAAPTAPMPPAAPLHGRHQIRHVLYVEDNKANSDVIRGALASRTWISLSVAPTIESGLAVLHDRLKGPPPDLVLLDVHLPDASGLEFLKLMKANPQTAAIPVIMISADAMPEQVDAALAAGARCYLTKPVQLPSLLVQVDELLAA